MQGVRSLCALNVIAMHCKSTRNQPKGTAIAGKLATKPMAVTGYTSEKESPKETVLLKTSKNLHMSVAAMTSLSAGLCPNEVLMLKVYNSLYLSCRHTNTSSVRDGIPTCFAPVNINNK
jgi:hypothetical protein